MSNWHKIKSKVNLIIDAIMLVIMMAVAGIGLLMKYVLLPGYKVNEVYGRNAELYFWGLDRHQWGAIHLYVALFLLFLLVLHILFHWDMIVCILKRMVSGRNARLVVFIILGLLSLVLALSPFVLKPEVRQMERPHNHSREVEYSDQMPEQSMVETNTGTGGIRAESGEAHADAPETDAEHLRHRNEEIIIDGTMTLSDVSKRYGLSVKQLAAVIGVPAESAGERLGRLKKNYAFDFNDLREFIILKRSKAND